MTTRDFSTLALKPDILTSISHLGFQEMTAIQEKSLPYVLNNQDLIAQAKTGSGKTAVFAIGLLSKIEVRDIKVQALVLCPTRELANQVSTEIRDFAKFIPNMKVVTLSGGKPLRHQAASLEHGAHIVVGTPGRIKDHLSRRFLDLQHLKVLVLDEADRMLDMGFSKEISEIVRQLPQNRQTLLFSATYPDSIKKVSQSIQRKPVVVKVESIHSSDNIEQVFYRIDGETARHSALKTLLAQTNPQSAIVFCRTKEHCQELAKELQKASFKALAMHGDLEQTEREEVLVLFANKSCSILVATDVASRGLDIKDVQIVVNYQLPRDPEVYIHRIGRTGRAGHKGQAFSFIVPAEEATVEGIAAYQNISVSYQNLRSIKKRRQDLKQETTMVTLRIAGGRRNRLCKGDILGALTSGKSKILGSHVGKIDIFDEHACVAINQEIAPLALKILENGQIKGRRFKVRRLC